MLTLLIAVLACGPKQEAPLSDPISEPIAVEEVGSDTLERPPLGEVAAIEAIAGARSSDRRSTQDPVTVKAVVDAINAATWTQAGGLPRCAHVLFIRLVPPSAEGGVTALWCSADGSAYVWVPGRGAYNLDDAGSAALWALSLPIGGAEGGSIPPTDITENLSSLSFSAGLYDAREGTLKSVELYTSQRFEPAGTWPDGTQMTAQHAISQEQARELVQVLDTAGFFARADRHHSAAVKIPETAPPTGSTESMSESSGIGWMNITVTAGEWHRTWQEQPAEAVFNHNVASIERANMLPEVAEQLKGLSSAP
jgi:hypothetical protein